MRRLVLMRHAKTEATNPRGDKARRLTSRGVQDSQEAGVELAALSVDALPAPMTAVALPGGGFLRRRGQGGLGDVVAAHGYDGTTNRRIYLSWAEAGDGLKLGQHLALHVKGKAQAVDAWEIIDIEE